MSHKSFRVLSDAVQNFAKISSEKVFQIDIYPLYLYWQYQHKQTQFLLGQNMECLNALPNSAWKTPGILSQICRAIYLSSRNELESDVLVRLVDELGVEPHVAVVVLQAVALQHLDGEHVALQLREPPPDTHPRS